MTRVALELESGPFSRSHPTGWMAVRVQVQRWTLSLQAGSDSWLRSTWCMKIGLLAILVSAKYAAGSVAHSTHQPLAGMSRPGQLGQVPVERSVAICVLGLLKRFLDAGSQTSQGFGDAAVEDGVPLERPFPLQGLEHDVATCNQPFLVGQIGVIGLGRCLWRLGNTAFCWPVREPFFPASFLALAACLIASA